MDWTTPRAYIIHMTGNQTRMLAALELEHLRMKLERMMAEAKGTDGRR